MARIAVSNSSPLISLQKSGGLWMMKAAFEEIYAPEAVADEVRNIPDFVHVRKVTNRSLVLALAAEMDPGEAEAIALAIEIPGATVLLDDLKGRRGARRLKVPILGTVGIVLEAKAKGLITSARVELDKLRDVEFYMSDELYLQTLDRVGERPA